MTIIAKTYEDAKRFAASTLECEESEVRDNNYANKRWSICQCACGETRLYHFLDKNDNECNIGVCEVCGED